MPGHTVVADTAVDVDGEPILIVLARLVIRFERVLVGWILAEILSEDIDALGKSLEYESRFGIGSDRESAVTHEFVGVDTSNVGDLVGDADNDETESTRMLANPHNDGENKVADDNIKRIVRKFFCHVVFGNRSHGLTCGH